MTRAHKHWLTWSVPAALWLWLFHHLHFEWTLNEQYNYGWAVPFLAALLFYQRWQTKPMASRPVLSKTGAHLLFWALLAVCLPLRAIEGANPDWRLLSWTLAIVAVLFSFLAIGQAGGSTWLRHFTFPICFPLVAVPWFVQVENAIVQTLTRTVATVAVEIAGWIGIGAYQLGNVIQLRNGLVGVDEACSGVKTLQAAIMVAFFLGEMIQLPTKRRIILVLGGCAWVFACNVMRATALVVIAARSGLPTMNEWHDFIGTAVLMVGMGGLVGLGWILGKRRTPNVELRTSNKEDSRIPAANPVFGVSDSFPTYLALAWLVLIFAATEFWYRVHERQLVARPRWEIRWPSGENTRALPIAEETRAILRYNHASSTAWEDPRGVLWWGFFGRWEPQRTAVQLVRSHSPEICLPAAGRTFRGELAPVVIETDTLPLRFRVYHFEQQGRPLFVLVCIQEDKVAPDAGELAGEWSARGRLLAVWNGQRNLGQRLLEIAVAGFGEFPEAHEAAAQAVRALVQKPAPTG